MPARGEVHLIVLAAQRVFERMSMAKTPVGPFLIQCGLLAEPARPMSQMQRRQSIPAAKLVAWSSATG
jgi:hypothetical protein